ncbi:tRNA (adenosine(37)-N6)-threonylcarbamoyltransferase complex dimerization subunit type 1 TsaB [Wenyingzhuangia sp. IMCC45533]
MALILNIETSTKNCSVGLSKDGITLAIKEANNGDYSHAEKLHVFIEELLKENNLDANDIDAVAVGKGPGSYTGLRIGVSAAKGLAYSLDIPLISVETLKTLAMQVTNIKGMIVPMIDARRLEVYSAVFSDDFEMIRKVEAQIIDETSFADLLGNQSTYFVGDGAEKCKELIKHPNAIFINHKFPSANEMSLLAETKFNEKNFEDTAYFEPFYLKDFVVTPQKKKSLI